MPGEREELVWSVTTHEHRERSTDWYWGLGVLALAGAAASIFFGNVLLAVIIAIGSISIGYLAARGPREHLIRIDARGLSVDGTRYKWDSVMSFWIERDAEQPRLFFTMRGLIMPYVSFELDDRAQGEAVHAHLRKHVEEVEQGPHLGEHLAEIFGL
jgi:hypothetical protein